MAPAALDRWWLLFGDATLTGLEDEALLSSSDARTAAARLLEARAVRAADTAKTFPAGSIGANAGRQHSYAIDAPANNLNPTGGTTDTVGGTFNLSWELDLFGRLKTARRVANATAAEARFNIEGTYASLTASVADAYFQLKGLLSQRDDARDNLRIERDLLEIAERKAAAGSGPSDDIDRVAGQAAKAEAQVATLQGQCDVAARSLLILVGRDLRSPGQLTLVGDLPAVPPTPAALPSQLLARRPDIREAEFRLRAELGAARLAHLAIFPTLTLLPGLGLSRTSAPGVSYIPPTTLVSTQQVANTGFWSLAAGLTAPTLDIPRLLDQARAEDARAKEAAIAYEKTVRTAFGESQNALVGLAAEEQAAEVLAAGEHRARLAYQGAQRRYAQGLSDLTATLTTEQDWRALHTALTAQRVEALRGAVTVYKALGGGWNYTGGGGG